jgi:membrane-associated protease RseP (regulator of RpoE activity)
MLFLISLIICIFLHELAHLVAAKYCKCQVEVFSVGFGPALFKKKLGDTIYQIALLPIGGYNKLKNEPAYSRSKYAFTNLPYNKKLLIILAGCTINIVTGGIALLIGRLFLNYNLFYFGVLSIALGLSNLLPIPALDGSYSILVWLEKFYGKKHGYKLMERIVRVGFIVLMILNLACIPYIVYLLKIRAL